jgi:YD repeat-containing protein
MPSPNANPTPITPPRVPLIDPRTGLIDRAWYLFFLSLNQVATGVIDNSGFTFSAESVIASYDAALRTLADEVGTQPVLGLLSQIAEIQKQIDALSVLPRLELLQSIGITYETVNKNLDAKNAAFTYDGSGNLTSITYTSGVIKTLNYTLGILTSVVLSGNTPQNIVKTKTLTYDGSGNLTNTAYT